MRALLLVALLLSSGCLGFSGSNGAADDGPQDPARTATTTRSFSFTCTYKGHRSGSSSEPYLTPLRPLEVGVETSMPMNVTVEAALGRGLGDAVLDILRNESNVHSVRLDEGLPTATWEQADAPAASWTARLTGDRAVRAAWVSIGVTRCDNGPAAD